MIYYYLTSVKIFSFRSLWRVPNTKKEWIRKSRRYFADLFAGKQLCSNSEYIVEDLRYIAAESDYHFEGKELKDKEYSKFLREDLEHLCKHRLLELQLIGNGWTRVEQA